MAGWHLLLLLIVEVSAYSLIARHADLAWGWSVGASVALGIGIYLGIRVVLVGLEFVLAQAKGEPIPDKLRVPFKTAVAMYFRELGGWLLLFTLILPFVPARRSVIDRESVQRSGRPPVVLIHGLACNRMNWFWFRRQLEERGFTVFTVDCTPWYGRIEGFVPQLARAIDEVLAATGAAEVTLIGHSMGGLISRAYLDRFGTSKVNRVITLGSPHQGTWMAQLMFTPNVRDMREGSSFLTALAERESRREPSAHARFTCVLTHHDNLVTPHRNALLPGADRIELSGVGHLSLAFSPRVLAAVVEVLERPAAP